MPVNTLHLDYRIPRRAKARQKLWKAFATTFIKQLSKRSRFELFLYLMKTNPKLNCPKALSVLLSTSYSHFLFPISE